MIIEIKNNKYVEILSIDLRFFSLYTDSKNIVLQYNDEFYIKTVTIEGDFSITLGQTIVVENNNYVINLIKRVHNYFYCFQEKITKTSQFIMPVLGQNYAYFNFNDNFYNCYISENYRELYLVYKFKESSEYLELEEKLINHSNFIEIIDPNPETVVIKMSIPQMFWKDVKLIMKGKYSEISPTLKSKICIFHKFHVNSRTYKVLYRHKGLKEELETELACNIPEEIDLVTKPILKEEVWTFRGILNPAGIQS